MSRFIIVLRIEKPGLHPRRPGFLVGSFYPCLLLIVGALVLYLAAPNVSVSSRNRRHLSAKCIKAIMWAGVGGFVSVDAPVLLRLRKLSMALGRASPEGPVLGGSFEAVSCLGDAAAWLAAFFFAASLAIRRKNSAFLAKTSLCFGETKRSVAASA
jgi:hypothetical protein